MLKEIGQIARGMLFLHGHLTRPQDLVEAQAPAPAVEPKKASRKARKSRWLAAKAARCEAALFASVLGHAGSFR